MVTEFAEITVKPGAIAQFIAGAAASKPIFLAAAGCHGMEVHQSLEAPTHFVLLVKWESVAAHTEGFYGTQAWQAWRANVGAFFEGKPKVWHSATVV
jgi:quinol monooxygenase YgiN